MLYCQCSEVSTTCLCITSMSRYSTQVTPTSIVNTQSMCRSGRRITPLLSCLPPSSSAPSWSTRWWSCLWSKLRERYKIFHMNCFFKFSSELLPCSVDGSQSSSGEFFFRYCWWPLMPSFTSRERWVTAQSHSLESQLRVTAHSHSSESQLRVTTQSHTSKLFNWTWEIWLNSLQTLIIKGPFWKKKKEIELEPNEANISPVI